MFPHRSLLAAALAGVFSAQAAPAPAPTAGAIALQVDATDTARRIFRVQESLPVRPGKLTLLYPQWIPGNHAPSGAINQFAGLTVSANGQALAWRRDPLNVYAFQLDVPAAVERLDVQFQYLAALEPRQGHVTMTDDLLGVQWQSLMLYPAGYRTRDIPVQPSLRIPAGWQYASALEEQARNGGEVTFKPLDLETLADSPLYAGRYFRSIDLAPDAPLPVRLNVMADTPEQLNATPDQIAAHRTLVQQSYKLFQSQHYRHYDFLLVLSNEFGGIGREHQQSSEDVLPAGYFSDWAQQEGLRNLLAHEFIHSWNGKFRRPAGQDVTDFNTPLQNELLWVYEGQTKYWDMVLATRAGLITLEHMRDMLAETAAEYDHVSGRSWRALQDTVNDPIINNQHLQLWGDWQRDQDYYEEGKLIWLDVDTRIRELSGERRSLDDFARAFFGVDNGALVAKPYTFDDVVETLNAVQPADWRSFLRARLDGHGPGAPLDGLARAGWKLVYRDTPSDVVKAREARSKSANFQYTLGFSIGADGKLSDISWNGLAFQAGMAGGATLLAVDGRAYQPEVLRAAIRAAHGSPQPIRLLVRRGAEYISYALDYHDGLKYPHLERIEGTPDRLQALMQALK